MPSTRYWAVVPAAGKGTRMGVAMPKQYLSLNGSPVIVHTLSRLLSHPRISGLALAVAADDDQWSALKFSHEKPLKVVHGGGERYHSVLNALETLPAMGASAQDWVLVHDATRPCIRGSDIDRLIAAVNEDDRGGLLGVPVADTIKRCDAHRSVVATVDRSALWRALTPQMFRLDLLRNALRALDEKGTMVTDDASAMEHAGYHPLMVEGHADNIKITRPEDLKLAALYLEMQAGEACA